MPRCAMGRYLDSIPSSGIMRIRDMMFGLENPYRLDQGDVGFDAPDAVKAAMNRAIAENKTHYVQTLGIPRLRELIFEKLRDRNHIPIDTVDDVMVTNGGIHALYVIFHGLLEPGDEVLCADPMWPTTRGTIQSAHGVTVDCPLYESRQWRPDLDELESKITPKTRAILLNSPQNPTGGVLTRVDMERIAAVATERDLWVISDEAYEDVVFDGERHMSIASLPGMYDRTIPVYTFSKSYAMTGLRLGYLAVKDRTVHERIKKVLYYTCSNIGTVVQWGGVGGLENGQAQVEAFRVELQARRDLFYAEIAEFGSGVLTGEPPKGAFYAFLRIDPEWRPPDQSAAPESLSWALVEYLIEKGRIGCVPGADFGRQGEGYIRLCFAKTREELTGALASLKTLLAVRA
ncbi:MAG: pyridoxal phosphate-dependent aminotransferase [Vicinamibacterales bacterium]|nr:pyridoxal phosphate-dependent aminotransferase [Vicinamibacterales bacterium]MDP7471151.1 pyridoxal phosphate-dependent aminotransferase [Vicinamibacterales bacterium]MDP7672493.1 pyridoxal phosphate-dependent aminotransferase [Vicinamibacterales bacterium]HJO37064.1 pyridoxal phosphate-dependent aminotransferase [Vicinamibacterales bacterium]